MPTVKMPLFSPVFRNVKGVELSDENQTLIDGYLNEKGNTVRRPGLLELVDLGLGMNNPVMGLFWWNQKNCAIAVAGGQVFKITESSGVYSFTNLTGDALTSGLTPSFATDGTYLFIAADGRIIYTDGTSLTEYIADADTPTSSSHVAYLDGYVLCNKLNTNRFQWSGVLDSLSWDALEFASAAGNSDNVGALKVLNREIFLFGADSVEVWENDGVNPFSRVPGGFLNTGCIALQSVTINENTIFWLNSDRHFVKYSNGGYQKISTPYDRDIAAYGTVSDCRGFRIEIAGRPFLLFLFPTEEKTLVYDLALEGWCEWAFWDKTSMIYRRWLGESYCYAPLWAKHLVGSRKESIIYDMSPDYYDDNGDEIRLLKQTGHIDYGTTQFKRSNQIRIRVSRGADGRVTPAYLKLRWRNNGETQWSKERAIDLGKQGEREIVRRLIGTGIYQTRQYEFTATDAVPIIFGSAEEDIEVLG